ncbi:bifunctional 2Fe-2S ferredoxin-type iron-sulfur binding domain/Adrenodoxin/2Fe-2S ferredoxin-like superfamily/Beta-grasp domain superfamily [Babesia duncani]|uniref:Bifunctional 2Fe-2S ferredoxin-type iron-sulfur binding domain/Adrenodoxin/2Fe-2S ferredoxin-like superfamily/Beta-grasp domain superfamily n=1 Tax=Babesia duncani TaxID=323732 RepID=A0AAD9UPU3_9APIC|nr:bifunctional 2Fe-2S ferredoxin-type iron-sulfur binding domain/Adrenodoxin/2Fe-2S ferredoxin-like superfamily/Beta-grasp domain superfamily [Babesia duncani]
MTRCSRLLSNSHIKHCFLIKKFSFPRVSFTFINTCDKEIKVTVPIGTSILEAAHMNEVELEGACDGCMACSTCHVIFDEAVFETLPEPEDEELDMLDLAPALTPTSRLGCQIKLDKSHQGIVVRLPKITRNFYVDGHVPLPH